MPQALGYAIKTRREGLLGLAELLSGESDAIVRKTLHCVLDEWNPDDIDQIFQLFLARSATDPDELLKLLLIQMGILDLQQGFNPFVMFTKLGILIGENHLSSYDGDAYLASRPRLWSHRDQIWFT